MSTERVEASARADRRARPPRIHTPLIGRDDELAHLTRLLRSADTALITITGRSGSGKTRLALEAAHRVGPDLPGGAVLIGVDSVADIGLLATAVAAALDLPIAPGQEPEAAIKRELEFAPALLLVDDIDYLEGAVSWFANLLEVTAGTKVLATAKAPLRIPGERVLRCGPLVSAGGGEQSDTDLLSNPAVLLFADRASAVQYDFKVDRSNVHRVADLCRRVDGLPLAIELAAARTTTLSPTAQIRLIERGSALDLGHGHGVLRDSIALTYDRLSPGEQQVLRGMAVFEGQASLEAAHAVTAPEMSETEFIDQLTTLVDYNLVEADNSIEEPRYRLLPMIREFATEKAMEADESGVFVGRQNDHFVGFARQSNELPEHQQVLALALERANLELVLGRLVADGDLVRGARLAADLGWLWDRYGWFPVAQQWLDTLIAATETDTALEPETRALPLIWWVRLSLQHPAAMERAPLIVERQKLALELARQSGNPDTILQALVAIYFSVLITHDVVASGTAAFEGLQIARGWTNEQWLARFEVSAGIGANLNGDAATAVQLAESALARSRRIGDLCGLLAPCLMLMDAREHGQDFSSDIPTSAELLVLTRELGDVRGEGWVLSRLSAEAKRRDDPAASLRWAIEALKLGRRTGLWDAAGFATMHLVRLAWLNGDDAAVARLQGPIQGIMPELSISMAPEYVAEYQAILDAAQERLGAGTFDRLASATGKLSWDEATVAALDYANRLAAASNLATETALVASAAVQGVPVMASNAGATRLTKREIDVLRLLATGATNNEIARELGLTGKTVMHHSVAIYAKLGVRGRAEATAWAYRNGMAAPVAAPVIH